MHPCPMTDARRLEAASEVVVVPGSGYNPRRRKDSPRLATESSAAEIRLIASLLTDVVPSIGEVAWMEYPTASIAFVRGSEVLAEFGLIGRGEWVRGGPIGDQLLAEPTRVAAWLAARGIDLS